MLLGATILKNVQSVNSFQTAPQITIRQGNATTIYFRLVDLEQTDQYGQPLRYIPASGSTLTASINALNQDNVISRLASQPYSSDDRSIWALTILSTDIVSQGNFDVALYESSVTKTTTILNGVVVWSANSGSC